MAATDDCAPGDGDKRLSQLLRAIHGTEAAGVIELRLIEYRRCGNLSIGAGSASADGEAAVTCSGRIGGLRAHDVFDERAASLEFNADLRRSRAEPPAEMLVRDEWKEVRRGQQPRC